VSFDWLGGIEIVAAVVLAGVILLAGLAIRRRWLGRHGGTFECSMRRETRFDRRQATGELLTEQAPSTRWVLGVARYSGDVLQWFRFFSLGWRPNVSYQRANIVVLDHRMPSPEESALLYFDQEVVSLAIGSGPAQERHDLAMVRESLTGMLSWLEAAPPDLRAY
jgi:hypothetical protein